MIAVKRDNNMKENRLLVLASVLSLAAVPASGQAPDTTILDPVVVTATRLPVLRSSVPTAVSVIDGSELRMQGVSSVSEALRMLAGVGVVESGSYGSTTSLFVRGGESDYVKVLIDGAAVNEPGGAYDFADLSLDNVERVEIVRGPASVLYGSDAMAGVVQIFTRKGHGKPEFGAGVLGGTHSSLLVDAYANGGSEAVSFGLGIRRSGTDGIHEFNSEYNNLVLSGSVSAHPDDRTTATLSARYGDSEFHYPTDGSGLIIDRNAFQARERISASLEVSRFVTQAVQGLALLTLNRSAGGIDDRLDNSADTLGFYAFVSDGVVSRGSADLRANIYLIPAATATAGVQIERQSEGSSSESLSQFGASLDSVDVERTTRGYYTQLQLEPSRQTTLVGGLRVDDSETFGTFVTYRGGATVRLGSGSVLRGSVGRGFKEPTFFENFATSPFVVGNPDLEPERSASWDAGLEQQLHGHTITLGATYFDQRFEDLIQYDAAPANLGDPNYVNVAAARSAGVELEARVLVSSWFSLRSNYTYLHTEVTDAGLDTGPDAGFVEGERLLRRPTHRAGLNVRYSAPSLGNLALNIHHVGNREDRDFSSSPVERVELPAYTKVDLAGELIVLRSRGQFPGLRLTARVENLFDRNYQEVVGFPARGRVILVGGRFGKF